MHYVKRMRRHKIYPGNNSYAPVYNLKTGDAVKGFAFVNRGIDIRIDYVIVDGMKDRVEYTNNIGSAWDIYEKELIRSIVEF